MLTIGVGIFDIRLKDDIFRYGEFRGILGFRNPELSKNITAAMIEREIDSRTCFSIEPLSISSLQTTGNPSMIRLERTPAAWQLLSTSALIYLSVR